MENCLLNLLQPIRIIGNAVWPDEHASTSGKKKLQPECPDALDALDASDANCLTRT